MSIRHLYLHLQTYGLKHKSLYLLSLMLLSWSIFDGLVTYVTPLVLTSHGLSNTIMGFIYGSSSLFGAIFDFVLSRYLKNAHFRRLFFLLFAVCALYPLVLWQSKTIPVYLIAMALWGIYYDLVGFGTFDFVGRKMDKSEHVSSFGVIDIFRALGHLIAPVIAGIIIIEMVRFEIFVAAWIALGVAFIFFLILLYQSRKDKQEYIKEKQRRSIKMYMELELWRKIGRIMLPILVFTSLINIYDAFFWVIGPIYSESVSADLTWNKFFLAAYSFPILVVGWFMGDIVKRLGKKNAAFISYLLGSLVLLAFPLFANSNLLIGLVVVSSTLISISTVTIKGLTVDYITNAPNYESEIEGIQDFSVNIGYIIGPILAGFFSDKAGNIQSFFALGMIGIVVSLILLKITPRRINTTINS